MKSLYLYEERFKCIGMYFPQTRICKAIYSAALTLTYIICINHKQWAISCQTKSTDYLRKDINIFLYPYF